MNKIIVVLAIAVSAAVFPLLAQSTNPLEGYSGYTNCYFLGFSEGSFAPGSNGDIFVDINFGGLVQDGETNLSQIGGVTVTNIQVDTGSRGLYVSSDLVSNVVMTNSSSWIGTNYLSSSKRVFVGHYTKTAVNFQVTDQNSNPTIATANIPVLVVDTLSSLTNDTDTNKPSYKMNNSRGMVILTDGRQKSYSNSELYLTGGEAVSYSNNPQLASQFNFGVGFGPNTNQTSPSGPVGDNTNQIYNALINLTTMTQSPTNGGMVAGYIIETDQIQLGLTESTTNFAYTQLLPSGFADTNSVPDWRLSAGEVVANGKTNGPVTILMDAGIGYAFLSTDILNGWATNAPNSLSVNLVNSLGAVGYNFSTKSGGTNADSNNIVAPSGVTNNGSTTALFMNTGRHVFYGFDMLYDAQNGYIGVITNGYGATNTNVFFTAGFYPDTAPQLKAQVVSFPRIPPKTYGTPPFSLSATASSKLPVSYSILSGPASISNKLITLNGAGIVSVQASQVGNSIYAPATSVSQSIAVATAAQTITFVQPSARDYVAGATFDLAATALGGVVTFTSSNTNVISVLGNTATINGAGSAVIIAQQAGNGNYAAAVPVSRIATVTKASQAITFNPSTPISFVAGNAFSLTATTPSGLAVNFTSSNPKVLSINGSVATIKAKGTTTLTATQNGDANWKAAAVSKTVRVE